MVASLNDLISKNHLLRTIKLLLLCVYCNMVIESKPSCAIADNTIKIFIKVSIQGI